jgi:hypothetical protein
MALTATAATASGATATTKEEIVVKKLALSHIDDAVDYIDLLLYELAYRRKAEKAAAAAAPKAAPPSLYYDKVKYAYFIQFTRFPFVLVGYNYYLREDVSMCIMYALTCGFFGMGALADFFFLPFQVAEYSRIWILLRKCYSYFFMVICLMAYQSYVPNNMAGNFSVILLSLFIANEVGLFTLLIVHSSLLYNEIFVKNPMPETLNPSFILVLSLLSLWFSDVRISDLPLKKPILKIIMGLSFIYYSYLFCFTPLFPKIAERIDLITWKIIKYQLKNIFKL